MYKVCLDDNIPDLKSCFDNRFQIVEYNQKTDLRELLINSESEYLFCRSTIKANEELLSGTKVKFIATATSGTDHFDKNYLCKSNIAYFDAIGSNSNSVAEYAIFGILHYLNLNNFKIEQKNKIGIIGFGNVGSKLAYYAHLLGFEVFVNDPPLFVQNFKFPNYTVYKSKEYICQNCDIISNHTPLEFHGDYPTYNLFDKLELELIKPQSLFIHASRGKVVNERFLLENAIKKDLSLIIDVWESEPLVNIELAKRSIIVTPHIAGHSYEGKLRGSLMVAESFEHFSNISLNKHNILEKLDLYAPCNLDVYKNANQLYEILLKSRLILDDTEKFINSLSLIEDERIEFLDRKSVV